MFFLLLQLAEFWHLYAGRWSAAFQGQVVCDPILLQSRINHVVVITYNVQNTLRQSLIAAPSQAMTRISNFKLTNLHKLYNMQCNLDAIETTPLSLTMYMFFDWVWFAQIADQSLGQEKQGLWSDRSQGKKRWRFDAQPAFHHWWHWWNIALCNILWSSHGIGRRRQCNFISATSANGHGDNQEHWFHRHLCQGNWNKLHYMFT